MLSLFSLNSQRLSFCCPAPNQSTIPFPQVHILELESKLVKERKKLAEIRKRHYLLAGESEGWEVRLPLCLRVSSFRVCGHTGHSTLLCMSISQ